MRTFIINNGKKTAWLITVFHHLGINMDTSKFHHEIDAIMSASTAEQIMRDILSQNRYLVNQVSQLALENAEIKTYYQLALLHKAEMHSLKFTMERIRDEYVLAGEVRKETPHKNKILNWFGLRKTQSI